MMPLKSQADLAAMAYETAVILQSAWQRKRVFKWVLKPDTPDRVRHIWLTAQAVGIIPKHLADELEPYLIPIYRRGL